MATSELDTENEASSPVEHSEEYADDAMGSLQKELLTSRRKWDHCGTLLGRA